MTPLTPATVRAIHKAYLEGGSRALSSDEVLEFCEAWLREHERKQRAGGSNSNQVMGEKG